MFIFETLNWILDPIIKIAVVIVLVFLILVLRELTNYLKRKQFLIKYLNAKIIKKEGKG